MSRSLLFSLLKGTDWSELASHLSPTFFTVVSPLALLRHMKNLSQNYFSKAGFSALCSEVAAGFDENQLEILTAGELATTAGDRWSSSERGAFLLRLYFHQIYAQDVALLDYRSQSFVFSQSHVRWRPAPLYVRWQKDFLVQIRALYEGFYEDDQVLFERALGDLGIAAGKEVLREHFGDGQSQVSFRLSDFGTTFNKLFTAAAKDKTKLPADFFAFGAGLVCLYEHLEKLGVPFDVHAAYRAARSAL